MAEFSREQKAVNKLIAKYPSIILNEDHLTRSHVLKELETNFSKQEIYEIIKLHDNYVRNYRFLNNEKL